MTCVDQHWIDLMSGSEVECFMVIDRARLIKRHCISSSIVNNKIIVLLTADIGIKINADNYCKLLKLSLMKYVTAKTLNSIFIQVNIPSYSTKLNNVRFARKDYKLME